MARFPGTSFKRLKRLRYKAYQRQGGKCYYCGKHMYYDLNESTDPMRCSAEHLIRVEDGGSITKGNIVAAHQSCNALVDTYKDLISSFRARGESDGETMG